MKHKLPSIASVGLREWLDTSMHKHNNYGYDSFSNMMLYQTPKSEMARKFGVNYRTILNWICQYDKEKENGAKINKV